MQNNSVSNLPIPAGILGWVGEVWVLVVLWIACGATPLALWRFDRQDGYLQILKELDCRLNIKGWPTQLNYLQFSLLYPVEDFQLRWKPKDLCLCKVWIKHSNKGLWVFFFWVHNSILDQFTLAGKASNMASIKPWISISLQHLHHTMWSQAVLLIPFNMSN